MNPPMPVTRTLTGGQQANSGADRPTQLESYGKCRAGAADRHPGVACADRHDSTNSRSLQAKQVCRNSLRFPEIEIAAGL
jgi:hypothetical protein